MLRRSEDQGSDYEVRSFGSCVGGSEVQWFMFGRASKGITKAIIAVIAAMVMGIAGCTTTSQNNGGDQPMKLTQSGDTNRVAICVGLTHVDPKAYDGWGGECPGCDIDARGLYRLFTDNGFSATLILEEAATWTAFKQAVWKASVGMKPGGLMVITMSGHGGQAPDDNGDEQSGQDSTLCMWDGQVRDDEFLKMIQVLLPVGIRLVLVNDQCHSEGNFKAAWRQVKRGVTFGAAGKKTAVPMIRGSSRDFNLQIIQFAGCREANYSYGSDMGGTWTQSLLQTYKPGLTWRQWFDAAKSIMPSQQVPVWTTYGGVTEQFINGPVLR
jgi:hypothetical protein